MKYWVTRKNIGKSIQSWGKSRDVSIYVYLSIYLSISGIFWRREFSPPPQAVTRSNIPLTISWYNLDLCDWYGNEFLLSVQKLLPNSNARSMGYLKDMKRKVSDWEAARLSGSKWEKKVMQNMVLFTKTV